MLDMLVMDKGVLEEVKNSSRIAVGRVYEEYEDVCYEDESGNSGERVIDELIADLKKKQDDLIQADINLEVWRQRMASEYEAIKDNLIIHPLNYRKYINELKISVYFRIDDVALVLYHLLGDTNGILSTSKIRNDELKKWGRVGDEEEIIQEALVNTARVYPPMVYNYNENRELNPLEESVEKSDIVSLIGTPGILLSTSNTTNGAIALFYPGMVERMMEIMGGAFDAVFMNINDTMITEPNSKAATLFAENALKPSEMGEPLSGKIYRCDSRGIRVR